MERLLRAYLIIDSAMLSNNLFISSSTRPQTIINNLSTISFSLSTNLPAARFRSFSLRWLAVTLLQWMPSVDFTFGGMFSRSSSREEHPAAFGSDMVAKNARYFWVMREAQRAEMMESGV